MKRGNWQEKFLHYYGIIMSRIMAGNLPPEWKNTGTDFLMSLAGNTFYPDKKK